MNIIIKTKNIEFTPFLKNLIEKRMAGVVKMAIVFQESAELLVEVEKENRHHRKGDVFRAEALIHLPGRKLVAKSHGENLSTIITAVRDELKREIGKYKTKVIDVPRRKAMKNKY